MSDPSNSEHERVLSSQIVELQQQLTFQQQSFDTLNQVVLEQQTELVQLRREVAALRQQLQELSSRSTGDDLPHEKPPHY